MSGAAPVTGGTAPRWLSSGAGEQWRPNDPEQRRATATLGPLEGRGEGTEAGQAVFPDSVEPAGEVVSSQRGEDASEAADVPVQCIEFGAVRDRGLEPEAFVFRQAVGVGEHPAGDRAGGGRTGAHGR
ncbi:hypothetical protein ACZ90_71265 [Streptomyces albus subsp. albus]|nr:hypothetical protein ACZ90_71265 [Streptomyces albus subsp. albus]